MATGQSLHNYFALEPEEIVMQENFPESIKTAPMEEEKLETKNSLAKMEIEPKIELISSKNSGDLTSSTIPVIKKYQQSKFTTNKLKSDATKKRDLALKKRKIFKQFVDFCQENSLRTKLTKSENDYEKIFDLDHCYTTNCNEDETSTASADNLSKKFFFRQLFVTNYNQLVSTNPQNEIFTGGNEINLLHNRDKSHLTPFMSTTLGEVLAPKSEVSLEKYTKDSFFDHCDHFATKIKTILNLEREDSKNADSEKPYEEILKDSIPNSFLRKTVEKVFRILLDQMLTKRTVEKRPDEMNIIENSRLKNAARLRLAFSSIVAEKSSIEIINYSLMKHLPTEILSVYIGLWKVLKFKVPDLVSRIFDVSPTADDEKKNISAILKEFFDAKLTSINTNRVNFKTVALAKNPIIVLISPNFKVFGQLSQSSGRCRQFFKDYFPQFGKCSEIKFNPLKKDFTLFEANQKILNVVVEKLIEIRVSNPTRHMILVGWDASCLIALISALEFPLAACVCLAFPNVTLNGLRGDVDDDILDVACPVLFVVGQFSSMCSIDDLQDTKEQMKSAKVGLVVVGGADNELKWSCKKLCTENVTQAIVDKCIMDTIGEFLNDVLVTLPDISPPKPTTTVPADSQVQSLDQEISQLEPESKRRCPDRSELKLTIKIPPVLEPEVPANQSRPPYPSPAFMQSILVPSTASVPNLDPPTVNKVQQRPRSSSAGTNLFFHLESPLGAYASSGPPQQPPTIVDLNDSFDDTDQKSSSGSVTPSVTRTRQIKKPQIFDL